MALSRASPPPFAAAPAPAPATSTDPARTLPALPAETLTHILHDLTSSFNSPLEAQQARFNFSRVSRSCYTVARALGEYAVVGPKQALNLAQKLLHYKLRISDPNELESNQFQIKKLHLSTAGTRECGLEGDWWEVIDLLKLSAQSNLVDFDSVIDESPRAAEKEMALIMQRHWTLPMNEVMLDDQATATIRDTGRQAGENTTLFYESMSPIWAGLTSLRTFSLTTTADISIDSLYPVLRHLRELSHFRLRAGAFEFYIRENRIPLLAGLQSIDIEETATGPRVRRSPFQGFNDFLQHATPLRPHFASSHPGAFQSRS